MISSHANKRVPLIRLAFLNNDLVFLLALSLLLYSLKTTSYLLLLFIVLFHKANPAKIAFQAIAHRPNNSIVSWNPPPKWLLDIVDFPFRSLEILEPEKVQIEVLTQNKDSKIQTPQHQNHHHNHENRTIETLKKDEFIHSIVKKEDVFYDSYVINSSELIIDESTKSFSLKGSSSVSESAVGFSLDSASLLKPLNPAVLKFVELVKDKFAGYRPSDKLSDHQIGNFLIGHKFKQAFALEKIKNTLKWMEEYLFENILNEDFSEEYQTGKLYQAGFAKDGTPIVIFKSRNHKRSDYPRQVRFIVWFVAKMRQRGMGDRGVTLIVDRLEMTSENEDDGILKELAAVFQPHFPETLKTLFIIPQSFVLRMIWPIVKLFLDPVTVSKCNFLSESNYRQKLSEFIDQDNLLESYGGNLKDPSETDEYLSLLETPKNPILSVNLIIEDVDEGIIQFDKSFLFQTAPSSVVLQTNDDKSESTTILDPGLTKKTSNLTITQPHSTTTTTTASTKTRISFGSSNKPEWSSSITPASQPPQKKVSSSVKTPSQRGSKKLPISQDTNFLVVNDPRISIYSPTALQNGEYEYLDDDGSDLSSYNTASGSELDGPIRGVPLVVVISDGGLENSGAGAVGMDRKVSKRRSVLSIFKKKKTKKRGGEKV